MLTGGPLTLRFTDAFQRVVDEEVISFASLPAVGTGASNELKTENIGDMVIVRGENFAVSFDRRTGLITSAMTGGEKIIEAGPSVRVTKRGPSLSWDVDTVLDVTGTRWKPDTVHIRTSPGKVTVSSQGQTDSLSVKLEVTVTGSGEIITAYEIVDPPAQCQEAGIRYRLTSVPDHLSWNRVGLWSSYPADHIGRPVGEVARFTTDAAQETAHQHPDRPWGMDTKDHYLFPATQGVQPSGLPVPHDFRARKENVLRYALLHQSTGNGITVISDGTVAARTTVSSDGSLELFVDNAWTYLNMNWGNYERPVVLSNPYRNTVRVQLTGRK